MVLVSNLDAIHEVLIRKGLIFADRPDFLRLNFAFGGSRQNSIKLCDWSHSHKDRRKYIKKRIVPNKFTARNEFFERTICTSVVGFIQDTIDKKPVHHYLVEQISSPVETLTNQFSIDSIHEIDRNNCSYKSLTKKDLSLYSCDIFLKLLCDQSFEHSDSEYEKFVDGCDRILWEMNQSCLIDFIPYLTRLGIGKSYLNQLKSITDSIREFSDKRIFEPRLSIHMDDKCHTYDSDSADYNYLDSIIAEHLYGHSSIPPIDPRVGFVDLVGAHAAVANLLMRLLGHLTLNLDIQDEICREARKVGLGELDYKPSLPITEAAMQETLRLASSPIVPHVARETTSLGDFHIPKGTTVLINNYYWNMSEDFWKEPRKFNPSRFIQVIFDDQGETINKLDPPKFIMPFSVGLRHCLGYKIAETICVVLAANLCSKYVIRANDESLVEQLLVPASRIALETGECFELRLFQRNAF